MDLQVVAIGILPSLADADLSLANLSAPPRYRALNQQVLRQRHGRPTRLDIDGPAGAQLRATHHDVMLEAAATSFQVHLQLPAAQAVRGLQRSHDRVGAGAGMAGNSPLLFGPRLWQETRIPLFEQALGIGAREDAAAGRVAARRLRQRLCRLLTGGVLPREPGALRAAVAGGAR